MQNNLPTPTGAIQRARAIPRRIAAVIAYLAEDLLDRLYYSVRYSRLTDPWGTRARVRQLENVLGAYLPVAIANEHKLSLLARAELGPGAAGSNKDFVIAWCKEMAAREDGAGR
jgi:hypothetical protein